MSELISGKEAKLAWANGEIIEFSGVLGKQWVVLGKHNPLSVFEDKDFLFRIKPKTIKIELEIPAPFEPKNGEEFYYLDCESDNFGGWAKTSWRNVESDSFKNNTQFGAWRTEDEIKQVVAALRGIKK